jgi:phosphotransferase system  glucose/maltose/N-acetylglucosamine-specific IIC component
MRGKLRWIGQIAAKIAIYCKANHARNKQAKQSQLAQAQNQHTNDA